MIQRKQTLFLFLAGFFNVALFFISSNNIVFKGNASHVYLEPLKQEGLVSTAGHTAAIFINFAALVLAFAAVFAYNKRDLQVKLCYLLAFFWLVIGGMIAFCPFVTLTADISSVKVNYLAPAIALLAVIASITAARYIKKDIELLKSADRIR